MPIDFAQDEHAAATFYADERAAATWHLDVRELLANGGEPYHAIMQCVHQIGAGEHLIVHALFEPRPLIRQLERMGYALSSARIDADHWTLSIARGSEPPPSAVAQ